MSGDALAGSQTTVSLSAVLVSVAERLQARFNTVVHDLPRQTAENRPTQLLQFLHDARQQLLRAAVLLHDTRKLPPLAQLVQPGGVLDIAANHARALQSAADELFRANGMLLWQRVPLFNVPDALDVLSTGTYSNLPSAIQDMRGPRPAQEQEQQRLLNQLNHLLYTHLLKAHLPDCLQLVEVTGGYAVLRCPGLYEVQLSLFQQPYPPQLEEARQAAQEGIAAAGAGQQDDAQQQQQADQKQAGTDSTAAAASTEVPSKPEVRWQWTLTHAVLLPNAAKQQPLRPVQMEALLRTVRERMWIAADAAAVEAAKRAAAASAGAEQPQADTAAAAGASQPAASGGGVSTWSGQHPAASTVTGLSGAAGGEAAKQRGLQMDLYGADEVTLPLKIMHAVLRDVAARTLLEEVSRVAQQLAAPGSKWAGHLKVSKAMKLTKGLHLLYWQQSPALLALPGREADAAAAAAAAAGASAAAGAGSSKPPASAAAAAASKLEQSSAAAYPAVEVGVGDDGTIQQVHFPELLLPGTQQAVQLMLDSHTVDVVGLLLQAVQVIVANQLQFLQGAIQQGLKADDAKYGGNSSSFLQLRLVRQGHLTSRAQQLRGRMLTSAAAAAEGQHELGVDAELQEQQQLLLSQLPDALEVLVEKQSALTVSFQPWSGKLVLRLGSAYGGDSNIELGATVHHQQEMLRKRQDQMYLQYKQQLPGGVATSIQQHQTAVVIPCLEDLGKGLTQLCQELLLKQRYANLVTAARMLSLQPSHHLRAFLSGGQPLQQLKHTQGVTAQPRQHQVYLAMPSMQLPPYMQLLAAGSWCESAAQKEQAAAQQQAAGGFGAGQREQLVPARLATLNPVLCIMFPRVPGAPPSGDKPPSSDWLLLVLSNSQGLPGPLVKELKLSRSDNDASSGAGAADGVAGQQPPTAGAAAVVAAGVTGRQVQSAGRKRSRSEAAEGDAVGLPPLLQQQQPLQQQQQPLQQQQQSEQSEPRMQQQADLSLEQLSTAVAYGKAMLLHERLLLELSALQVDHTAAAAPPLSTQQQQQQQVPWTAPAIRLVSIPGVELYQQLQRPAGCSPAAVGLQHVWLRCGPGPGQWCVQLCGALYNQQQRLPAAGESLWQWQFDFGAGQDVRGALLQLQRLLHMQHFLNRLELLSCGRQQLDVLQHRSSIVVGVSAAAVGGLQDGEGSVLDRPAKKQRHSRSSADQQGQQQQQQGDHAACQADGVLDNGLQGCGQGLEVVANGPACRPLNGTLQSSAVTSNGQLHSHTNSSNKGHSQAPGPAADSTAAGGGSCIGSSGSSKVSGLLWHWPSTGLVHLASYSCFEAVLQCSRPLPNSAAAAQSEPPQQQSPAKVQFHVCWQPKYEFGTGPRSSTAAAVQPSVGLGPPGTATQLGGSGTAWPSSSNTTTWLDAHTAPQPPQQQQPQQQQPQQQPRVVLTAQEVLSMGCCVSCSSPSVPETLLAELADMASCGFVDQLLDALSLVGWPLSQLRPLLSESAPARVGALLAKAAKRAEGVVCRSGGGAAGGGVLNVGGWWPSVVVSMPADLWREVRVTVGAEAAGPGASLTTQQQQGGEAAAAAAGGDVGAAPRMRYQLLLDFCLDSRGRVKLTVRQQVMTVAEVTTAVAAAAPEAETAAEYASSIVHAAWKHLNPLGQNPQGPKVGLLPTFGSCSWQRQIPQQQQGAGGGQDRQLRVSGFWVTTPSLSAVLSSLLEAWTHHVVKASAAAAVAAGRVRAAAAAAAATSAGATGGVQVAVGQQPAQQPMQQQQHGQVDVKSEHQQQQQQVTQAQQQQLGQAQVLQPNQQATLQAVAAARATANLAAHQQQQQQQMMSGQPGRQQQQGPNSQGTTTLYAAVGPGAAGGQVAVQAMAVSMPAAGPGANAARPVAVAMPMQQQGGMMSHQGMAGMQYGMQMLGPNGATYVQAGTGWPMGMPGMQQQQHPAQQQQRQ